MKADNRGVCLALRRAVHVGDEALADFLTDEIVRHLDLLDTLLTHDELVATLATPEQPVSPQFGVTPLEDG